MVSSSFNALEAAAPLLDGGELMLLESKLLSIVTAAILNMTMFKFPRCSMEGASLEIT